MLDRYNPDGEFMKKFLVLAVLSISTATFASEMDKARFETRKAKTMEMADKRIASLQALKSCVKSATEKESLKKCQESHREKMMGEIKARKEMRMKRKDKKKS